MPGALLALAQDAPRITREMLEAAEKIAGLSFTPQEHESILARLNSGVGPLPGFDALRHADLRSTPPVLCSVRFSLERLFPQSEGLREGKRSRLPCRQPRTPLCPPDRPTRQHPWSRHSR